MFVGGRALNVKERLKLVFLAVAEADMASDAF